MNWNLTSYVETVDEVVSASVRGSDPWSESSCRLALFIDGEPRSVVAGALSRDDKRRDGIFFSGKAWAARMVDEIEPGCYNRFVDPSCGTGDLLLELAHRLPLGESLESTLQGWSEKFIATDIHEPFVRIAWGRIKALAILRHNNEKTRSTSTQEFDLPAHWGVRDGLIQAPDLRSNDCVIMNPPYSPTTVQNSAIGTGSITSAAIFLEKTLISAPTQVAIVALVPDVIRSGTRYQKLRELIHQYADVKSFEPVGRFGSEADIDVAILVATTKSALTRQLTNQQEKRFDYPKVADEFEVHVGSVVPHRTPVKGTWHPYLTVGSVSPWEELKTQITNRRFDVTTFRGPFVVIRRTSSPTDKKRARASVVASTEDYYIENHLIVCTPKDGKVSTCRRLVKALEDPVTDNWLNYRIRCRHLTVKAVGEIPFG